MKFFKLTLLIVIASAMAHFSTAQTDKGTVLLGATSDLTMTHVKMKTKSDNGTTDDGKYTAFNFAPIAGYFIMDNLVIGADLPITRTKRVDGDFENSTFDISIVPFARYYFDLSKVKPFAHIGVGYGSEKDKRKVSTVAVETTNRLFNFNVGGGIAYFINDNMSIDLLARYAYRSSKQKEDNPNNVKNIRSGLNINVGFSLYF